MLTSAKPVKNSLVIQMDLNATPSVIRIEAAHGHRFAVIAENFAHSLARMLCEVSRRCLEPRQNLQILTDHDLKIMRQWNEVLPTGVIRCVHDMSIERARF